MDPTALRQMVHDKLQRGLLPPTTPLHEVRATEPARKVPRTCAACEAPLTQGEAVYELETSVLSLALHVACHAVWRAERGAALTEALAHIDAIETPGAPADIAADIRYVVDDADRLVACSREPWQRFALDNDAADLAEPDRLLQRSLFDFIRGERTRRLYLTVHRRLKRHPHARVVLTGRCDGPTVRRTWRVSIAALVKAGRVAGIVYRSTVLEGTPHREVRLLRRDRASSGPGALAMCSLCLRVRPLGGRRWIELERHADDHPEGTDVVTDRPVCPRCERNVVRPALRAA